MAGLIPQPFIDDLIQRLDIVEVIDRRVRLKKSGRNYTACCPFHEEKTPSFSVSPEKQMYHCFGCGVSGNALGFLMAYENLAFPAAVESLAQMAGVDVPRAPVDAQAQQVIRTQQDMYALLEQAAFFYCKQLQENPKAELARAYLKQRGLSEAVIATFGIGYAPAGWDALLQHLLASGWLEPQLIEAGMLVEREDSGRRYDRFRDRIMFPIRDVRGRVIAFGGRVLGDEKPKYLNSPETALFSKGRELYGLYEANRNKGELKRLLVVEGYMDVVALAQFGLAGAVATLGTAAGTVHLDKAFRYYSEVVFCFDGDAAGRRAATRALDVSLPALSEQRSVKFLFLAEGEDPDSYVRRRGLDAFTALVEKAQPLSQYLFEQLGQGLLLDSAEGRAALVSRALPQLARLPAGPFRQQMFIDLSLRTQNDRYSLEQAAEAADVRPASKRVSKSEHLVEIEPSGLRTSARAPEVPAMADKKSRIELSLAQAAIHILLCYPPLHEQVTALSARLSVGVLAGEGLWLLRLAALIQEHPHASTSRLLGLWHGRFGDDGSGACLYALADREKLLTGEQQAAQQLQAILQRLLIQLERENPLQALIEKSRHEPITELEKHELKRLLTERS